MPPSRERGASPLTRVRELAESTPARRDRYLDLLRAVAILAVVVGHWLASAVTATDGRLGGVNLLYVESWTHPLTWLFQVLPVFFLVGGYVNAASLASHYRSGGTAAAWVRSRALRLLYPTAVFLLVLVAGYAMALGLGADAGVTRRAVWLAGISLWFLVVYVAVVALAPAVIAGHRRWGMALVAALVAVVAVGDLARWLTGSDVPAAANHVVAWLVMHQLGVAWRDGLLTRRRRTAWLLAVGGAVAAVLLTALGPYAVMMVGAAEPPELGNTDPPTLALLALAAMQVGLVLLLRPLVAPWLQRPRVWLGVVGMNAVILTVYLWHMVPVVVAGAALVATGLFPQPPVGSGAWFALRLPWLLILAVVLAVLVTVFARFEVVAMGRRTQDASAVAVGLGVAACLAGLAGLGVTGMEGVLPAVAGVPVAEVLLVGAGLAVVARSGRER